jgi:hypothetical protein
MRLLPCMGPVDANKKLFTHDVELAGFRTASYCTTQHDLRQGLDCLVEHRAKGQDRRKFCNIIISTYFLTYAYKH